MRKEGEEPRFQNGFAKIKVHEEQGWMKLWELETPLPDSPEGPAEITGERPLAKIRCVSE